MRNARVSHVPGLDDVQKVGLFPFDDVVHMREEAKGLLIVLRARRVLKNVYVVQPGHSFTERVML